METPRDFLSFTFPRPPRLGWCGRLALAVGGTLAFYALGFAVFVVSLPQPFTTLPPNLEGLATFTGGAGRVQALLHQLNTGFSGPILISGTRENTSLNTILAHTKGVPALTSSQKNHILQDPSRTTRQNVESLRVWAAYLDIHTLGVITSTYHTLRVRLLTRWMAPELTVVLLPVQPADPGLRPLLREYNKLLLSPLLP